MSPINSLEPNSKAPGLNPLNSSGEKRNEKLMVPSLTNFFLDRN